MVTDFEEENKLLKKAVMLKFKISTLLENKYYNLTIDQLKEIIEIQKKIIELLEKD